MAGKDTNKSTPKKTTPAKKAAGAKKEPTLYMLYMKKQIAVFKAKNPSLSHKEAFTQLAKAWKTAPENPNKGK
ncbi:yabby protein [Nannochloropsis oceanica]